MSLYDIVENFFMLKKYNHIHQPRKINRGGGWVGLGVVGWGVRVGSITFQTKVSGFKTPEQLKVSCWQLIYVY